MSDLIIYDKDEKLTKKEGEKIYKSNENMRTISDVMEDRNFRKLFDENFNDWNDIKSVVMLMKTYQLIENSNENLDKHQKLYLLNSLIKDSDCRNKIAIEFNNWIKKDNSQKNLLE